MKRHAARQGFHGFFAKVSDEILPEDIPSYQVTAKVAREAGWRPFTTISGMIPRTAEHVHAMNPLCDQWQLSFSGKDQFLRLLKQRCSLSESTVPIETQWYPYTNGDAERLAHYVFIYSPDTPSAYNFADHVILMRVPRDRIRVKNAYEFFAGNDAGGRPTSSPDVARPRPVFTDPGGCNRMSVTCNAPLQRYFLTMRSGARQRGPALRPEDQKQHHFGVYDASQPWGPWTTVYWTDQWEDIPLTTIDAQGHPGAAGGWGESQRIPSKWISADGQTIHLVFSGEDRFKVRRAELTLESE